MKNIRSKSNHSRPSFGKRLPPIFFITVSILVLAVGSLYALEKTRVTNFVKDPSYVSNKEKTEEATKNDPTTRSKGNSNSVKGVDSNKTTNDIPDSTNMSVSFKSASQNSGIVKANVDITNSAPEGVCSFTFTKENARPVTRSVTTTSNTCDASIPEQEFEMVGDWQLTVDYFANNTKTSTTGRVTIE